MFLEIALDSTAISALLTVLIKVLLWSLIIATPFIVAILLMYSYRRYKKWSDSEDKEQERIILGRAKKISQYDEELSRQADERKKIEFDIELLSIKKRRLQEETDTSDEELSEASEELTEETIDLLKMNIKQLKEVAKKHGIKRYSKLSKQELLNKLQEVVLPGKTE